MSTMPAVQIHGVDDVRVDQVEVPEAGPGDVLVRVAICGICGSDLHIYRGKHPSAPLPVAIGHELSGQVIKTGESVKRVKEDDRVAVEPVIACGVCHFCRRGSYHLCRDISFQYRVGQGGFTPYHLDRLEPRWSEVRDSKP